MQCPTVLSQPPSADLHLSLVYLGTTSSRHSWCLLPLNLMGPIYYWSLWADCGGLLQGLALAQTVGEKGGCVALEWQL